MKLPSAIYSLIALIALSITLHAQKNERGILGRKAPAWEVTQWLNLPEKSDTLDITDFKGKVVYLYNFQSWCPGCHSSGFPTLKEIITRYGKDPDVAIVAVQTAFEGFASNGFDDAKRIAKRYELTIPVGQSGTPEKRSALMKNYRTGGTPWTVIIDPGGIVRYNDFHITGENANALIDRLKPTD